jgi:cytochrome c peroxidase
MKRISVLLLVGFGLFSCKKDNIEPIDSTTAVCGGGIQVPAIPTLPDTPFQYDDFAPHPHLTGQVYDFFNSTPNSNPVTVEGATLGRVLFYDKQMSFNNTVACASCHNQEHAFGDPEQFSTGLNGELTGRHSMAIVNPFMGFRFFWDNRANGLEQQALMPIEHPVEMGMDLDDLEVKLAGLDYYPALFEAAFGDSTITQDRVSKALAQFMRSMYSIDSKFDEGIMSNYANFTAQELEGKDLFFSDSRTNCNNCHQTYYFFDPSAHNNGSESNYSQDEGYGAITGDADDIGKFKTATLRNIEYTAPYFHDGRFATLEDVVNFYNSGIQPHPNLDDRLTTNGQIGGPPKTMNLSPAEVSALVAFLKTLSEPAFLTKERWSNPFE